LTSQKKICSIVVVVVVTIEHH